MSEVSEIVQRLLEPHSYPAVLATLVDIEGSSYRRRGARLLHPACGGTVGSISGGCLEEDLLARATSLLQHEHASGDLVTYDTTAENDLVWGVGLGCHGIVRVLLEKLSEPPAWVEPSRIALNQRRNFTLRVSWAPESASRGTELLTESADTSAPAPGIFDHLIVPRLHLVIFGAGDDAAPLARLAADLDWQVTLTDPRSSKATAERFPTAQRVFAAPPESAPAEVAWDDRTVAVVMTHHYRYDVPLLKVLGRLHLPYLGLLGPRDRGERILIDAELVDQPPPHLHAPIGLDLGGDGATAVALAVVAEIQAVMHERTATSLRHRAEPIHAR